MNQHQSQFPNNQSELNYALSDEPMLLNGMKVIFDQKASVYPVNLQLKNRKKFNNSLAKSLDNNSRFSGALDTEGWKEILKLGIEQNNYFPLNRNDRLNQLVSDPWKLNQGLEGQCGFAAVIMAMLYLAEEKAGETGKQEVLKELLEAIYFGNQFRRMFVTKRAVVKEDSIIFEAKDNTIEVLTINLETKEEKSSPIQVEKDRIEIQEDAHNNFRSVEVRFKNTIEEQTISIKVDSKGDFVRIKAIKGVVKKRLEKRLAHYIHHQSGLDFYVPRYVTDYVLYVGLMLFFKDHLQNNLDREKPKLWKRIMNFNAIFPGFKEQGDEWLEKKAVKKLKDMERGERAYPGYKKGDLGLTREGMEELCILVGIAGRNNPKISSNINKKVPRRDNSLSSLEKDIEEEIFKRQARLFTNDNNNDDLFLLNLRENIDSFPCILGLADGKRVLSDEKTIKYLDTLIENEQKK